MFKIKRFLSINIHSLQAQMHDITIVNKTTTAKANTVAESPTDARMQVKFLASKSQPALH